jgi:hypothetical protein
MSGGAVVLWLTAVAIGLGVLYLIIRAAVYQALSRFPRDASRVTDMREGHGVPRRIDRLATHLTEVTRRPPQT